MSSAKPGIAWWRLLGLCIALAATWVGIDMWAAAIRYARELHAAETADIALVDVDLSAPGTYEGPIRRTFRMAHGEMMVLLVDGNIAADAALFEGLDARWEVIKPDHGTADGSALVFDTVGQRSTMLPDDALGMWLRLYEREGTFRIIVNEPAAALAGRAQAISLRYEFCGLEHFMLAVEHFIAIVATLIALVFGVPVAIGLVRYGWRRRGKGTPGSGEPGL